MNRSSLLLIAVLVFVPASVAVSAQEALPEGLADACIETELADCHVTSAGFMSLENGPQVAFQIQRGRDEINGDGGGVALFERAGSDDTWRFLASAFDAYEYRVPTLAGGSPITLHVPGYMMGTGNHNADMLLAYDGSAWAPVDIDSWKDTIGKFLPEDREIWKGVDYDFGDWLYGDLTATTPLWDSSDPNCCPSGGDAIIHFDIVDAVLTVRDVALYLPKSKQ